MDYNTLAYQDWLRGWKSWASNRKRGKLAQFIVGLLETGEGARWVDITKGKFELTEWHSIAQEWYRQKTRASQTQDAPCMLRKGLPRAFPDLEEIKQESMKDGTQYRSRMFQCPPELVQEVYMCATGQPLPPLTDPYIKEEEYDDMDNPGSYSDQPIMIDNVYNPVSQNGFYPHMTHSFVVQQEGSRWNNVGSPHSSDSVPSPQVPFTQQPSPANHSHTSDGDYSNSPRANLSNSGGSGMNYGYYQEVQPPAGYMVPPTSVSGYGNDPHVPSTQGPVRGAEHMPITLLIMRALPNKSPCEGGGEVALIFRQQLPVGAKHVRFQSLNGGGSQIVEPRMENESTLSAPIPAHPRAELVYLQLICNGQVISQTEFEFYQTVTDDLSQIYHMLNSNMSAFFPAISGPFASPQSQGGQSSGMPNVYGYGGSPVNYAYLLLLGSCKFGISDFVSTILQLPNMYPLLALPTPYGLPEDIARQNSHIELADHLKGIRENFCDSVITPRASRPSLEELLGRLTTPGAKPKDIAESVMKGIKEAAKECNMEKAVAKVVGEESPKEKEDEQDRQSVDDLTDQISSLTIEKNRLKRDLDMSRRDKIALEKKIHTLEQEVEESKDETPKIHMLRSERLKRMGSPNMSARSVLPRDPSILSDHGICVSFDEDVAQRRLSSIFRSGQFSMLSDTTDKSITVTVPGEMNIADSLIYEAYHIVTEDYPPCDNRPIFRSGDRIIEINGSSTRGLNNPQMDELLRKDAVTLKVVPKVSV